MVVMATVEMGCMCMLSTIVEGTGIMQIQPKSALLSEAFFLVAKMLPWQPY